MIGIRQRLSEDQTCKGLSVMAIKDGETRRLANGTQISQLLQSQFTRIIGSNLFSPRISITL